MENTKMHVRQSNESTVIRGRLKGRRQMGRYRLDTSGREGKTNQMSDPRRELHDDGAAPRKHTAQRDLRTTEAIPCRWCPER